MEDPNLYNQITVKNIDNEDFVFKVEREHYMIKAGETRIFPKFMVRPMLKHLIDKILIKRDIEGKLLRRQDLRDELAARIVLNEEAYERPKTPSDRELVNEMNTKQPELDRILAKNKTAQPDTNLIPSPKVDTEKAKTVRVGKIKPTETVTPQPSPIISEPSTNPEEFAQIKDENNRPMPTRASMMKYAEDILKLDISEPKTKKAWHKTFCSEVYRHFES